MAHKKTLSPMQKREQQFRKRMENLAQTLKTALFKDSDEIEVKIEYIQYLHSSDATRLSAIEKQAPVNNKSRILCIFVFNCPKEKLCLYKINNILSCQWTMIDRGVSSGIQISFLPSNVR